MKLEKYSIDRHDKLQLIEQEIVEENGASSTTSCLITCIMISSFSFHSRQLVLGDTVKLTSLTLLYLLTGSNRFSLMRCKDSRDYSAKFKIISADRSDEEVLIPLFNASSPLFPNLFPPLIQ